MEKGLDLRKDTVLDMRSCGGENAQAHEMFGALASVESIKIGGMRLRCSKEGRLEDKSKKGGYAITYLGNAQGKPSGVSHIPYLRTWVDVLEHAESVKWNVVQNVVLSYAVVPGYQSCYVLNIQTPC